MISRSRIKRFDSVIKKITRDSFFYAYIPHNMKDACNMIITHKKCLGFHIIEEGFLNYRKDLDLFEERSSFKSIYHRLGYGRRCLPRRVVNDEYINFYSLSDLVNPKLKRRVVVDMLRKPTTEFSKYNNSALLVLDANSMHSDYDVYYEMEVLSQVLELLEKKGYTKLMVKIHPHYINDLEYRKILNSVFNRHLNLEYNLIDRDVMLELFLLHGSNLTVISGVSSILIYAALFGQTAITYVDLYIQYPHLTVGMNSLHPDLLSRIKKLI